MNEMECSASKSDRITSAGFPSYTPDFDWKLYKSLVDNYFAMHAVTDDAQQKQLFFAYLPSELFDLVWVVIGQEELHDLSMLTIFGRLDAHFQLDIPPSTSLHKRNFYRRERGLQESVADYAKSLKVLADQCHFGKDTNKELCECFVLGLNDDRTQTILSDNRNANFDSLVKRATMVLGCTMNIGGCGDGDSIRYKTKYNVEPIKMFACEFQDKGCDFQGSVEEVKQHMSISKTTHYLLQQLSFLEKKIDEHTEQLTKEIRASQQTSTDAQKQMFSKLGEQIEEIENRF